MTSPEIALPELDGKTAKVKMRLFTWMLNSKLKSTFRLQMYRGGKICLTDHFKPLWGRNAPKFGKSLWFEQIYIAIAGIAHAMALGLGPWMAVEIPDLIEKVWLTRGGPHCGPHCGAQHHPNHTDPLLQGVITYKEKAEGASSWSWQLSLLSWLWSFDSLVPKRHLWVS